MSEYKPDWKTKVFFRFLKEQNLLNAFLSNFKNPKTRLARDKMVHDVSFFINRNVIDFKWIICDSIVFDKTIEGYGFWLDVHNKFMEYFIQELIIKTNGIRIQ